MRLKQKNRRKPKASIMAIRTTVNAVKDVVNTSISEQTILNVFIATASLVVDENLVGLDPLISAAMLARIELYLAGHFVALSEEQGGLISSEMSDSAEKYANVYSAGYSSTRFGQMAMVLDTSGTLKRLGAPTLKAEFRVV